MVISAEPNSCEGIVEVQHRRHSKSILVHLINVAYGHPTARGVPEYLLKDPEEITILRQAILDRICDTSDHILNSAWHKAMQEHINANRISR